MRWIHQKIEQSLMTSTAKRLRREAGFTPLFLCARVAFEKFHKYSYSFPFGDLGAFPSLGKRRRPPMRRGPTYARVLKKPDSHMKALERVRISRVRRERLILTKSSCAADVSSCTLSICMLRHSVDGLAQVFQGPAASSEILRVGAGIL